MEAKEQQGQQGDGNLDQQMVDLPTVAKLIQLVKSGKI